MHYQNGQSIALIRMIDDTFIGEYVGISDDEDGVQLEQSLNLLREEFVRRFYPSGFSIV